MSRKKKQLHIGISIFLIMLLVFVAMTYHIESYTYGKTNDSFNQKVIDENPSSIQLLECEFNTGIYTNNRILRIASNQGKEIVRNSSRFLVEILDVMLLLAGLYFVCDYFSFIDIGNKSRNDLGLINFIHNSDGKKR